MVGATVYIRFQGTVPDDRGVFPGIFKLVNGLARDGRLSVEQERFRRTNNDWYDAAYANPSQLDPLVYDWNHNPGAVAWFKPSAGFLFVRVPGYLEILTAHDVGYERLELSDPGRVVYEDEHQVIAVPHPTVPLPTCEGP
ncbi:hypothetical protein [Amycolatopsis sp. H20-H5]|uniref:hypothetical protein n=1 Tax=Amycolatopsis sp. H20-H5 TaxID=3046309 RepID=UPI002DB87F8F|nr:hypothetical protein [Amycolatopsis sp. H20-H5]MEC3975435.1 hypothetical protein [Amycolatopsis sp. H20-H5]